MSIFKDFKLDIVVNAVYRRKVDSLTIIKRAQAVIIYSEVDIIKLYI